MTFEQEVAFDFDYEFTPGEPQTYDYPGDGPEVRITKVRLNGKEIPDGCLTAEQEQEMIDYVLDCVFDYDPN